MSSHYAPGLPAFGSIMERRGRNKIRQNFVQGYRDSSFSIACFARSECAFCVALFFNTAR
ncbi:MAG: hypothetical protein ACJASX_000040 [Limisphaerales bacterium]|jgi:hypothetical protein